MGHNSHPQAKYMDPILTALGLVLDNEAYSLMLETPRPVFSESNLRNALRAFLRWRAFGEAGKRLRTLP